MPRNSVFREFPLLSSKARRRKNKYNRLEDGGREKGVSFRTAYRSNDNKSIVLESTDSLISFSNVPGDDRTSLDDDFTSEFGSVIDDYASAYTSAYTSAVTSAVTSVPDEEDIFDFYHPVMKWLYQPIAVCDQGYDAYDRPKRRTRKSPRKRTEKDRASTGGRKQDKSR